MRLIDADAIHYIQGSTQPVEMDYVRKWHIDRMPTIEAEPIRHGHWIQEFPNVGHLTHFYLCSVCRAEWNAIDNDMERFDYCPECGAKMDEEDEDASV